MVNKLLTVFLSFLVPTSSQIFADLNTNGKFFPFLCKLLLIGRGMKISRDLMFGSPTYRDKNDPSVRAFGSELKQEGDPVWFFQPQMIKGLFSKLERSWEGLHLVQKNVNRIQLSPNSKPKVVYFERRWLLWTWSTMLERSCMDGE